MPRRRSRRGNRMSSAITEEMLQAAMTVLIEAHVVPAHAQDRETYAGYWRAVGAAIETAIEAGQAAQLAPHEARKLYDLLAAKFGFGEVE
jgi:hypothetical protein